MKSLMAIGLGNALAAALLAVLAAAAARLVRRASVVHALWLLVLIKLVTPPLWPVPILKPSVPAAVPAAHEELPDIALDELPLPPVEPRREPVPASWTWVGLAGVAWLSGACLWWLLAARRLRCFCRLMDLALPAPEELVARARLLAQRMGLRSVPRVALVPGCVSPMLLALGRRARLLLPADLWPRLSPRQQDALLAHELAHLRRGDHWARRLELLVLGLYWWFPVAWWARRGLQEAEEECCDARALSVLPDSAVDYATALLETVAFLSDRPVPLPASASGAGRVPVLKRRLTMILNEHPPRRLGWAGLLLVLSVACLVPLMPTWARAPEDGPKERRPVPPSPAGPAGAEVPVELQSPHGASVALWRSLQQSCARCHVDVIGAPRPTRKPTAPIDPEWRPLHDDLALLYEQFKKVAAAPPDLEERALALQEDLEIREAQLRIKALQADAADRAASRAIATRRRVEELAKRGAVSQTEVQKAQEEAEQAEHQSHVRQAELAVERLQLTQVQRRLARLKETTRASKRDAGRDEERLRELKNRADQLLRELETVQKEIEKNRRRP